MLDYTAIAEWLDGLYAATAAEGQGIDLEWYPHTSTRRWRAIRQPYDNLSPVPDSSRGTIRCWALQFPVIQFQVAFRTWEIPACRITNTDSASSESECIQSAVGLRPTMHWWYPMHRRYSAHVALMPDHIRQADALWSPYCTRIAGLVSLSWSQQYGTSDANQGVSGYWPMEVLAAVVHRRHRTGQDRSDRFEFKELHTLSNQGW